MAIFRAILSTPLRVLAHLAIVGLAIAVAVGGCDRQPPPSAAAANAPAAPTPSSAAAAPTPSSAAAAPTPSSGAAAPAPFPPLTAPRTIAPGVQFYDVRIEGNGPGRPMTLNIYLPAGNHPPKSLPCVVIAPAGAAMYGMMLADGDRVEHLPYVAAGFAVVAYEVSGSLPSGINKQHMTYGDLKGPIQRFMEAEGGVINGRTAIDYVLERVPEVAPDRLYACGHSSAATQALDLAAADVRIRACCAYAPCTDLEHRWSNTKLDRVIPGFNAFASKDSPLRHAGETRCPIYLFHADDDTNVPLADNQAYFDAVKAAGKDIIFDRVTRGDHYDSMIKEGIPRAIRFMIAHGASAGGAVGESANPAPADKPLPPPPNAGIWHR